jgi:hypothetical protein
MLMLHILVTLALIDKIWSISSEPKIWILGTRIPTCGPAIESRSTSFMICEYAEKINEIFKR